MTRLDFTQPPFDALNSSERESLKNRPKFVIWPRMKPCLWLIMITFMWY